MADPDDGEDDAGNHHVRPHHHEKAKAHQQRYRDDDAHLSLHRHALFLHKRLQMFFVKLSAHKPVVEFLGRIGKAKHRHQEKGTVGRMGSATPTQPSPRQRNPKIKNISRFSFIGSPSIFFYFFPTIRAEPRSISHLASLGLINIPFVVSISSTCSYPCSFNRSTNICIFPYRVGDIRS